MVQCRIRVEHAFGLSVPFTRRTSLQRVQDPSAKTGPFSPLDEATGAGAFAAADIKALLAAVENDDIYSIRLTVDGAPSSSGVVASTKAVGRCCCTPAQLASL